ncbi:hypothetical protein ACJJH9_02975 [Microbulbifer sp. DLAB2-AF]|uniref:hypothetical protein n=1 Tax=Microbulbifer sp. DLAB2-AF TaxID=3243395 RepID=UPI00403A4094
MRSRKILSCLVSVALTLGALNAQALPDARQGNPLSSLGIQAPDGIGDVVRDHEDPNTLYVGPAGVKQINGIYTELDSSGAMCIDYAHIRKQAYYAPPTDDLKEEAYDNHDYISNYFQMTYVIPNANAEALRAINGARSKMRDIENGTRKELAAIYNTLKAEWYDLEANISSLKAEQSALDSKNTINIGSCITTNVGNQNGLIQCLTNNANWYTTESNKISSQLAEPIARKKEISQDYYAAKGEMEAYQAELAQFESDIAFNSLIINAQIQVTDSAWSIEKEVERAERSKIVGRASAGYNLFDNEANILSQTLSQHGKNNYKVKQLDVFNVSLNSGVTIENPVISTANDVALYKKNTWSFPADTLMRTSVLKKWEMPFEREERGDVIHFDTMDADSFASGGFNFYVTKGARCGEYSQYVKTTYTSTDSGTDVNWTVSEQFFEPQPNRTVFSESIGLSYNYYAYPGPLRGECSINVDRMHNYWRNSGSRRGWSWFRSKTKSWDITKTEARDDMGVECTLDLKPESNNPEEARQIAEDFERQMYNDLWQMFITVYAKEYNIEILDPEVIDAGKSTVGKTLGDGVMKMCGANVYCQIGGVVLKTLDEIGGSKAQGKTSAEHNVYGKIWKRFDKDTWTVKSGSALVNLRVCVDKNQCD